MRRTVRRIAFVLLLAAAVNVAVAWSCACWSERSPFGTPSDQLPRLAERSPLLAGYPIYLRMFGEGVGIDVDVEMGLLTEGPDVRTVAHARAGWPWHAARMTIDTRVVGTSPATTTTTRHDAIDITSLAFWPQRDSFTHSRHLPVRIIPLGFALNTLAYAGVLGTAWWSAVTARRARRRRRGRCIRCNYELNLLKVCPECGVPRSIRNPA